MLSYRILYIFVNKNKRQLSITDFSHSQIRHKLFYKKYNIPFINVLYYLASLIKIMKEVDKSMSVKSLNDLLVSTLNGKNVRKNLSAAKLVEKSLSRKEATLSSTGA